MEAQEESVLFWGPLSCFFSCCPCFYSFDCRVWMLLFYLKTNVLWLPAFTLLKYLSMHFWKFVLARIWHFNQRAVYALRFSLATKILLSLLLLIKICMMMIVLARLSCCRWWRICFMINLNLKFHYALGRKSLRIYFWICETSICYRLSRKSLTSYYKSWTVWIIKLPLYKHILRLKSS